MLKGEISTTHCGTRSHIAGVHGYLLVDILGAQELGKYMKLSASGLQCFGIILEKELSRNGDHI